MSAENCSDVTVTNVQDEGGDDDVTVSDRVVLMLDMSSETFAGSLNECTGRPTDNPEIKIRAASDQQILDMAVKSDVVKVPMVSGNESVCVHCLGSGTSVPFRMMSDRMVEDVVSGENTEQNTDVRADTANEVSNRQTHKVRRRSRLSKGRGGKKKKKTSRRVRAKGSGDTVITAPPPTSTSPPEVKILREVHVDLSSSTDSGNDESSDNNVATYSSGDRCRRSGRCTRFNRRTSTNAPTASELRQQAHRVLQSTDRPWTRGHRSRQRLGK